MMSNFPCPHPANRAEQARCRVIALVTVKGFAATVIFHAETKSDRLFTDGFNTPVDFASDLSAAPSQRFYSDPSSSSVAASACI
jgi:hypothetical protein